MNEFIQAIKTGVTQWTNVIQTIKTGVTQWTN